MASSPDLVDIGANLTKLPRRVVREQLLRARAHGVVRVVVTGYDLKGSAQALGLASWHRGLAGGAAESALYCTAGVHPHAATSIVREDGALHPGAMESLEQLLRSPLCVAVGECGLDYDRMFSPREHQLAVFDAQLQLAARLRRPVFCHVRDGADPRMSAYDDALAALARHPGADRVCVHCFTGDATQLGRLRDAGVHVGLTGFVGIHARSRATVLALRAHGVALLRERRLMLETDAPFMLPDARYWPAFVHQEQPSRGRVRNEPAVLHGVCLAVADAMGVAAAEVASATTSAADDFFGLSAADAACAAPPPAVAPWPDPSAFGRPLRAASARQGERERARVHVLRETLAAFQRDHAAYFAQAMRNVARWNAAAAAASPAGGDARPLLEVRRGDWGVVAHDVTRERGVVYACLNMASAYCPGGGYTSGSAAQEENMFRRSDCHFSVVPARHMRPGSERYTAEMADLVTARHGRVYLDMQRPRVCIRGPEDAGHGGLGYEWLPAEEVFPFWELRAAACDMRKEGGGAAEIGRRVAAQLDTLIDAGVRHVVLSAFGCGAYKNPADCVARAYRDHIAARRHHFEHIAFAIHHPGYGPDNFSTFKSLLGGAP